MTLNEWRTLERYKKEIYNLTIEWLNKESISYCKKLIELASAEDSIWIWKIWDITDLIYAKTFMWYNYIYLYDIESAVQCFKEVDEYWKNKVDFDELVIDDIWVYFFIWYSLSILIKERVAWNMINEVLSMFHRWFQVFPTDKNDIEDDILHWIRLKKIQMSKFFIEEAISNLCEWWKFDLQTAQSSSWKIVGFWLYNISENRIEIQLPFKSN